MNLVILWYAAGAAFVVWNVFQSPGLDFRFVALGALLPLAVDAPLGRQAYAHTLLASVLLLAVVMVATRGRGHRLLRRQLIGLPIGTFCGILLAGSWRSAELFWWPALGPTPPDVSLLPGWPVVAIEEAIGLAAVVWFVDRFGLSDAARRRAFVRTGRLSPAPS